MFRNRHVRGDAGDAAFVENAQETRNAIGGGDISGRKHTPIYKGEAAAGDLTPLPADAAPETPVVVVITVSAIEHHDVTGVALQLASQLTRQYGHDISR